MSSTVAAPSAKPTVPNDQYISLAAQSAITAAHDLARSHEERAIAITTLLQHGLLQDARQALADIGPIAQTAALAAFCDRLWAGETLLQSSLPNAGPTPRKCSSVMVAPCPGATRCIAVFSGIALLPFPTLPEFAKRQNAHLIFLFDPTRRFLLARTPRLGASLEETQASIAAIIAALGGPALFCAGVSSGGYPALRYGLALGAQGVLNFSGPTTVDMDDDPGAPTSDYPQLVGIYRSVPHLAKGTARPYDEASPRPGVILIYGESHKRDRFMAHLMGDRIAPDRGVFLRPMPDFAEHDTFTEMLRRGALHGAIDDLLALTVWA